MFAHFGFIIAFTVFSTLFVIVSVALISRIVRPKVKEPIKETIYECGEPAIGSSWVRFDIRFYTVAIVFLLFEVEVAFLFPWALVFKGLQGAEAGVIIGFLPFVFVEAAIFLIILGVALIYVWAKGDLDWVKAMGRPPAPGQPGPEAAGPAPEETPAQVGTGGGEG